MRKSNGSSSSSQPLLKGVPFGVDPILGLADRQRQNSPEWVPTYGKPNPTVASILGESKVPSSTKIVNAAFASDASARKQKQVRRAQARQRDVDALSQTIQQLPDLYNQDRDRLNDYVNRNLPTSGTLQNYAAQLKSVRQTVLGAARQGPAAIARLMQKENDAARSAGQLPWYEAGSFNTVPVTRPGSFEDRMLALDSAFGNDPTYRRQRDLIKYRVQGNARSDDPDADMKTALHVIGRPQLNRQFQRQQQNRRVQDQIASDTAKNASAILATNPNHAASAEQVDDFYHQTGELNEGERNQARVDQKVADARNEWLQMYKTLNLDLYRLPAGAARAVPGLLWQMFIGSTLSPEQRKKQFEVLQETGIFDNLANRIPFMGTLDGLSQLSKLSEESARNRSIQPFADAAQAIVEDKIASFNPVNRFRSMNPWEEGITDREKVDRAFNLMDFGMSSGDRVGKVIQKYKDRRAPRFVPNDSEHSRYKYPSRVSEPMYQMGKVWSQDEHGAGYPTRPGTNSEQIENGRDAATDLLIGKDRKNPRLRVTSMAINNAMQYGKGILLKGKPANTAFEVAAIAQILRDPRFETLRYIFVKDGKVVHVEGVSSRLPGSSGVFPYHSLKVNDSPEEFKKWLGQHLDEHEADGFYVLHNHPSGNSEPSSEDVDATMSLPHFDKFRGHVVINSNEYSVIHPFEEPERRKKFDFHGKQDPHFVNVDNHEFLGKAANPASIVNYARSLKSPGNWITLVGLTGSRNKLFRAGSEIPMPKLDELNGPQGIRTLAAIRRFARLTGSARVVPVVPAGTFERLNEGQRLFLSEAFYNNAFHDLIDENGQSFAIEFGLNPRDRNAEKEFGVQPTIRSRG